MSIESPMQYFWGAPQNFLQNRWNGILSLTGENEILLFIVGPLIFAYVPFWISNFFLLCMDLTGKPSFLYQYKIQADKTKKIPWSTVRHTIWVVFRNQMINIPVLFVFYPLFKWRGIMTYGPVLPTFLQVFLEFLLFLFVLEILFYYSHRFFHLPAVYKRVHKIHHEWITPIGITSLYCHPVESIVSNTLSLLCGPLLFGTHLSTYYLWLTVIVLSSTNAHCGYHFPLFPANEAHDYHHLKFNEMFGVIGVLDHFHNTDARFRVSINYKRSQTFFSRTPIRHLIPDPPKFANENVEDLSTRRQKKK